METENTVTRPPYVTKGFLILLILSLILAVWIGSTVSKVGDKNRYVNVYDYSDGNMYQYQCTSIPEPGAPQVWEFEETEPRHEPELATLTRTEEGDTVVWTERIDTTVYAVSGIKHRIVTITRTDLPDGTRSFTRQDENGTSEIVYSSYYARSITNLAEASVKLSENPKRSPLPGLLTGAGIVLAGQLVWFVHWRRKSRYEEE